jgi:hypothetical protein
LVKIEVVVRIGYVGQFLNCPYGCGWVGEIWKVGGMGNDPHLNPPPISAKLGEEELSFFVFFVCRVAPCKGFVVN